MSDRAIYQIWRRIENRMLAALADVIESDAEVFIRDIGWAMDVLCRPTRVAARDGCSNA